MQHFFGALRYNGGLNNHPEASSFVCLYRLISTYALVKPPRGSNVSGGKMLQAAIGPEQLEKESARKKSKEEIRAKIAKIVTEGGTFDPEAEISLTKEEAEAHILGCFGGYVAKISDDRWCDSCPQCKASVICANPELHNANLLTEIRSYGFLKFPSLALHKLLYTLEEEVLKALHDGIQGNLLCLIMDSLVEKLIASTFPLVGCEYHCIDLTEKIIYFFVTTRMYIASRVETDENLSIGNKKKLAKVAILQVGKRGKKRKSKNVLNEKDDANCPVPVKISKPC